MWILTPLGPGGEAHYLLASKEYVVGRKNCDILLINDQSISRAHAQLTVTDQTLTLKDTSKYGTFVNSQRLSENTPVTLKSGDNITFGAFDSKFSVEHQRPVVCSSCLDNDGKATLSQSLLALGGKLVNTWTQDCTHLAMPSVKVTIKTISALLCCRPIVKPEFFSELNKAMQQKLLPPKADSFIPEIDEPSLSKEVVNLGVIPGRKKLFTEKTFVFLNAKQLKRLSAAVSFGKGRSHLLEEGSLPQDLLESPQSCVIDVATGGSQTLLSSSTTAWANSVRSIVQRKGLRVITESEIGLAAIYASCDIYCNPSSQMSDTELAPKVNPRIPSASLSQSVAVDETVLPAVSQNITAYAANTEPPEGSEMREVAGVTAVGETPEKKQNQNVSQHQRGVAPCIVPDTMSFLLNSVDSTGSQRKKAESRQTVSGEGSRGLRSQPSTSWTNGGVKTFPQRQSPQKPKLPAQTSPQKQSTLTNFFQPLNKKRPLDDEFSAAMSEPKRPVLASSISRMQAPNSPVTSKETFSRPGRPSTATSHTSLGFGADLVTGRSEDPVHRVSHAAEEEPKSRKRKEMEEELQMEELESIMSEDMDFFDEQPSGNKRQQAQPRGQSSNGQTQSLNMEEALSSTKRQRVHVEDNGISQKPPVGLEKESGFQKNHSQKTEPRIFPIKTEQVDPSEYRTTNNESSKAADLSSSCKNENIQPFEEDDKASFIEDKHLLEADMCQPKEETKISLKPVLIKQEAKETKIDEDLPKKLVLVEFRSLTVSAPSKTKVKQMSGSGYTKNFKCFRKNQMLGAESSAHIIGGSDLLVHNRGKNSDLDEWLKDVVEEERQSRRDETVGEDLFRYDPTKLTKKR